MYKILDSSYLSSNYFSASMTICIPHTPIPNLFAFLTKPSPHIYNMTKGSLYVHTEMAFISMEQMK